MIAAGSVLKKRSINGTPLLTSPKVDKVIGKALQEKNDL